MKYLKRIFESNEMDDTKKYIYDCFVDFLDEVYYQEAGVAGYSLFKAFQQTQGFA